MMTLKCPKCQKSVPLSEDDVAFFYPRFFCLGCGEKIALPVTPEEALRLDRKVDRERRLNSTNGHKA